MSGALIASDAVHWFSILPDHWNPESTDADGCATLTLRSERTQVAVLREGYEPRTFVVVPGGAKPLALEPIPQVDAPPIERAEVDSSVVDFESLDSKHQLLIPLTRCRREPVTIQVMSPSGHPLEAVEILASSFLYLPMIGIEPKWGRLPLEVCRTDSAGRAEIHWTSGFENRACIRAKGMQEIRIALRDPATSSAQEGVDTVRVQLAPLESRRIRFRVLDAKSRKPVGGAVVTADEARDGLPPSEDCFKVESQSDGITPEVLLQGPNPVRLSVHALGYRVGLLSPSTSLYEDGETITIWLSKGKDAWGFVKVGRKAAGRN